MDVYIDYLHRIRNAGHVLSQVSKKRPSTRKKTFLESDMRARARAAPRSSVKGILAFYGHGRRRAGFFS